MSWVCSEGWSFMWTIIHLASSLLITTCISTSTNNLFRLMVMPHQLHVFQHTNHSIKKKIIEILWVWKWVNVTQALKQYNYRISGTYHAKIKNKPFCKNGFLTTILPFTGVVFSCYFLKYGVWDLMERSLNGPHHLPISDWTAAKCWVYILGKVQEHFPFTLTTEATAYGQT